MNLFQPELFQRMSIQVKNLNNLEIFIDNSEFRGLGLDACSAQLLRTEQVLSNLS